MRLLILIFAALALAACAKKAPQAPSHSQDAAVALAQSANSVSQSLQNLDATEQAANPPHSVTAPPNPATYGMAIPASLNWTGPADTAIAKIAEASNYKFRTVGQKPVIPLIVSVNRKNSTLGAILRDIGLQCKQQAQVVIFPKLKLIELRYLEQN
jgi:hypothetical protein